MGFYSLKDVFCCKISFNRIARIVLFLCEQHTYLDAIILVTIAERCFDC